MPHAQLQLLDAAVNGGAADAELARGFRDVAPALFEQLLQRLRGGLAGGVCRGGPRWRAARRQQRIGQVFGPDGAVAILPAQGCGVAQRVVQLAQVAGPGMRGEHGTGGIAQVQVAAQGGQHLVGNRLQVAALAQRRQLQLGGVEAVEQVFAEAAAPRQFGQRPVRCRDEAHGHRPWRAGAQRGDFGFGQHPQQLGLQGRRHVADLVEKQRAFVRRGDQALAAPGCCAGPGAGQVAEQLAFQQRLGNGRAVDGDEGAAAATGGMQRAGQVFLARAGLPLHQDGQRPGREPGRLAQQRPKCRIARVQRLQCRGQRGLGPRGLRARMAHPALGLHGMGEEDAAIAGADDALLRGAVAAQLGQVAQVHVEKALQRLADERVALAPVQWRGGCQQAGARVGHGADAAARIDADGGVGIDVEKIGRLRQAHHPVVAGLRHQVGVLHAPCRGRDEVERQVLAGPLGGGAQQRQVEHCREFAAQVVDGCGGAGQAGVREIEMVALVHGQRFARCKAGPHGRGAGMLLAPLRTQVQARAAQVAGVGFVPQEVHRHAVPVRQQQHVVQALELLVEPLQRMAGDVDQRTGFFAVRTQFAIGNDVGFAGLRRVEPVVVDAAAPAAQHGAVAILAARGVARAEGFDFLDVRGVGLQGHGVESMRSCLGTCRGGLCARGRAAPIEIYPLLLLRCSTRDATGVARCTACRARQPPGAGRKAQGLYPGFAANPLIRLAFGAGRQGPSCLAWRLP